MAKPMENISGSGMHFHISFMIKKAKNLFAERNNKKINPKILIMHLVDL